MSADYIDRLVTVAADHWLIHPALILEHGRACREAAWSRFAIVRVLVAQGWTNREIAEALGRVRGRDAHGPTGPRTAVRGGPDHTQWVRQVLKRRYENEEVQLLEAILREVPA